MTEFERFTDVGLEIKTVFNEIKNIITQDKTFEVVNETLGEDEEGRHYRSLHAKMSGKKQLKIQNIEIERLARGLVGAQREVIVIIRGEPEDFTIEIAAGKMTENFVASAITGAVIAGPIGLILPGVSVVFARKYEMDLKNKIVKAINTLTSIQ